MRGALVALALVLAVAAGAVHDFVVSDAVVLADTGGDD